MYFHKEDDRTQANLFKVACTCLMTKYEMIDQVLPKEKNKGDIHIYISVYGIFRTWESLLKSYDKSSPYLTKEYIVACILEIAIHFRKARRHANIYFYRGDKALEYGNPKYEKAINEALDTLLPQICIFIPKVYYIHTKDMPDYVSISYNVQLHIQKKKSCPLFVLLVSNNALDYTVCQLQYESKIRYSINRLGLGKGLFTEHTIITDWLFKDKHLQDLNRAYAIRFLFIDLFLSGLLIYPKKSKFEHVENIRDAKKNIFACIRDGTCSTIDCEGLYKMCGLTKEFERLSMSLQLQNHAKELDNYMILWHVDNIDYSIEKLNENIFRNIPIDIAQLCYTE